MTRCVRRYGSVFTIRFVGLGNLVYLTDPEDVKAVFTGDPDVFRAGEANQMLEPVLGQNSVLLIDGEQHLRRRRVLLPPFHGESIERYRELIGGDHAARGRPLAAGAHVRAAAADAGDHARGDPAGRVRDQRGGAARAAARPAARAPGAQHGTDVAADDAAAVRALEPGAALRARAGRDRRAALRRDPPAQGVGGGGRRRAFDPARGEGRGWQRPQRHGAARRADDGGDRGPRDDGDGTVMDLRPPASPSHGAGAARGVDSRPARTSTSTPWSRSRSVCAPSSRTSPGS